MLKRRVTQVSVGVGVGLCVLAIAAAAPSVRTRTFFEQWIGDNPFQNWSTPVEGNNLTGGSDEISPLVSLSPAARAEKLEAIAKGANSTDRNRARYLLASDLIQQGQGQNAISWLKDLEQDYPALAPQIALKRAQAYESFGATAEAQATWKELLSRYPKDPAAAEALYALGKTQPKYWDQAIAEFPAHPRTVDIAQIRLQKNPKQPELLLLQARHALYKPNYVSVLDKLSKDYAAQLTPQDWEAIAFGYWEKQQYGKAGAAYARAPRTALNAYRVGRGLQLGERGGTTVAYQQMVQQFPSDRETSLALIRLSKIVSSPTTAVSYLDQIIQRFPDRAPEALLEKSKLLDSQNSQKSAAQTRQVLLTQYNSSDAAAELRWSLAQRYAANGNFQEALKWAQAITQNNPDSAEFAPEAGFWAGKWAQQLGKQREAAEAYQAVLTRYPHSYYAWRSAVFLGWEVGDFHNVRQLQPPVERLTQRPELPAGSAVLKELHQLGQDRDAWTRWQAEFSNKMQPTVAEQFTDGVMRLGVGDNLEGIFMLTFLSEREIPEEKAQVQELRQQLAYWQALYPFPFLEQIENWSKQRQLNPLLVTALIRQESRFMPGIRSVVGAIGLMQVMPDTGDWIAKQANIKNYDLDNPEDNIKFGTWYLDYTHREYSDNSMLAVASYNAGPGAVAGWLEKGIRDPDVFVEAIPYSETRGYVKSVFENYWNYLRLYSPEISNRLAQLSPEHRRAMKF
jgi:soluble lytic murein transglycosylase